jgi:hypothetical protein
MIRAKWENLSGLCVKVFRSDNGGEFINDTFTAELESAGIERQCSAPYAHQQNGKAECVICTIEGRMYTMLDHARLPRSLWGEAALTVAYLFNQSESHALPPGKTPYEMLNKSQLTLAHLRVFGARCFTRIPMELQEKLGPRSREAIFMGYPPGVKPGAAETLRLVSSLIPGMLCLMRHSLIVLSRIVTMMKMMRTPLFIKHLRLHPLPHPSCPLQQSLHLHDDHHASLFSLRRDKSSRVDSCQIRRG